MLVLHVLQTSMMLNDEYKKNHKCKRKTSLYCRCHVIRTLDISRLKFLFKSKAATHIQYIILALL